jgi:hypothetical protein
VSLLGEAAKIIIVRYVPGWIPGAGFQGTAREWRGKLREILEKPFAFTRQRMAKGEYQKSYVTDFYEKAGGRLSSEDESILKWTSVSILWQQ